MMNDELMNETKQHIKDGLLLPIHEIFGPTIQGEGHNCGKLCYFVRISGCDQSPPCKWCDTLRAYSIDYTNVVSIDNIIEQLRNNESNLLAQRVIITGGNPCTHNCGPLIKKLKTMFHGIEIHIETQGTVFPKWLNMTDYVTISPKPPSANDNHYGQDIEELLTYIKYRHIHRFEVIGSVEIKLVVFNIKDMFYAIEVLRSVHDITDINSIFVNYTIQMGTDSNGVNRMFTVNDILGNLKDYGHSFNDRFFKNLRILPQVHNVLNVK